MERMNAFGSSSKRVDIIDKINKLYTNILEEAQPDKLYEMKVGKLDITGEYGEGEVHISVENSYTSISTLWHTDKEAKLLIREMDKLFNKEV